jgi:hypothetical protein
MAAAFAFSAASKSTGSNSQDASNPTLPYDPLIISRHVSYFRTWASILRALQHPSYIAPTLKATLISRISKLQNSSDAYPLVVGQPAPLGDTITIDDVKFNVSQQAKDLTAKLSMEVQLDPKEAFKIVYQQSKLGIADLEGLVKAYMRERTAVLRAVKCLWRMDLRSNGNAKSRLLAQDIITKVKEDKEFLLKLVQGLTKRVGQQLPPHAVSDPATALIWSRQVILFKNYV